MRARDCAVEAAGAGNAGVPVGTGGTHRLNCTYGTGSASGTTIHGDPNGMVLHEQFHCALKYLTGADNRKLAALAQARSFAKEAVIVGLGPSRRGLYLLTSGVACMVRSHLGQDTVLTQFGAGELVGEFSYLLRSAGQTLIYAAEPVEAQVISDTALTAWLASEPGLGVRFYQSLAAHVWQRRAAANASAGATATSTDTAIDTAIDTPTDTATTTGIIAAPAGASALPPA